MRRFLIILSALVCVALSAIADDGEWRIYASYHNASKAVKVGTKVYVLASGNLYSYDTEDTSVELYDKANSLSSFGIKDMAYSATAKRLVIIYGDANMDLLDDKGQCWNMPDLKAKPLSDKTINELKVIGGEALISINSGLVMTDIAKRVFAEFYPFDEAVMAATIHDGKLYVKTTKSIYEGNRSDNLLDKSLWRRLDSAPSGVVFGQTAEEKAAQDEAFAKVKDVVIDSPTRGISYRLYMHGERLLVAGGNFYNPANDDPGTALKYEGGKWTAFDEKEVLQLVGGNAYMNVTDIVQDPADSEHHWIGTARSGIYEFKDYKLVKHYSYDNSALESILPDGSHPEIYVRVTALAYDHSGNLWMCNNLVQNVIKVLKADGKWKTFSINEIAQLPTWDRTIFDRRGWAWINQRRTTNELGPSGLFIFDTNGTIDLTSDDRRKYLSSFHNQDGILYTPDLWYCAVEDINGAMWVGNTQGIFVSYDPSKVFNSDFTLSQVKVPRNDGSSLADYLLSGEPVKCIAIDGGNRKWVGTLNNGVYLVSADGLQTIHHFTADNSPLISNEINDIAINGQTGEVFIATGSGLCSYQGDATDPSKTLDSDLLKVWPNPVRPEYQGDVHIRGLMQDTNVKIVNAAGRLVHEGTSVGGEFTWNCCTSSGRRVGSGIYYALCTDEEGNEGACAKILIVK